MDRVSAAEFCPQHRTLRVRLNSGLTAWVREEISPDTRDSIPVCAEVGARERGMVSWWGYHYSAASRK